VSKTDMNKRAMSEIRFRFSVERPQFRLNVEQTIPGRGVTALFGPSGCGKSTLLRCLAGLEKGDGELSLGGAMWQLSATGLFLPPERRPVGYVFQEPGLFPHLSVEENLRYGWQRTPAAKRRLSFEHVCRWLGLTPLIRRSVHGLSGGERQRVAIGRALLRSPRLLLMDEPMSALDAASKSEILPFLERLHRELEIPVIYVSHDIDEVAQLADHVLQMEAGSVIAAGPATELLSRPNLPVVAGEEPGTVIEAEIREHDDAHHLSELILPGGQLLLAPRLAADVGGPVRVRIPAREVSISLNVPEGTSILNILPARIVDHSEGDPGRVLVQLELERELDGEEEKERVRLLSRISRYSWDRLGLQSGMVVQAQVKSMGLTR